MIKGKVSICIATYNMACVLADTLANIHEQDYPDIEVIVYDDCSTDATESLFKNNLDLSDGKLKYIRGEVNNGVGEGFNAAMGQAQGEFIVLMCADDLFTDKRVISDMVRAFNESSNIAHVSRFYYQFVNGYEGPVRAWRSKNPIVQANNPSGLAFRAKYLISSGAKCSNKMFVETTQLVSDVLKWGDYRILPYDAVAVRVWQSTSTQRSYWLKRRVSSPVLDQVGLGADEISKDYVSLIQIKRAFTVAAVWEEICNFVKVRPRNLIEIKFYFWALAALIVPRSWTVCLPAFYRHRIGRLLTREIKRP